MELRQLEYVVAVADGLSFSRAADRLFVSQSAISHQISRLERELSVSLFDRSTRHVTLTPEGAALLPIAREIIALRDRTFEVVRPRAPKVRLAANMSFARASLTAIADLRRESPDTEIEFMIKPFAQRIEAVRTGDVDLALIRGSITHVGLITEELAVTDLQVAFEATHALARSHRIELADLARYPLLLPPSREQVLLHSVVDAAFATIGKVPTYGPPIRLDHPVTFELINQPGSWTVLYDDPHQHEIVCRTVRSNNTATENRLQVPVTVVIREDARPNRLVAALLAALRRELPQRERPR